MTYLYKNQEQLKIFFKQIQLYVKKQNKNESDLPWTVAACTLLLFKNLYTICMFFYIQYVGLFIYNM